jgi:hypothetical protein
MIADAEASHFVHGVKTNHENKPDFGIGWRRQNFDAERLIE